ncbi:hypothetical protein EV126DRAFT_405640 [Verticillium dahliae]|nr:hypothetical protein EV126DRAFT_405640 [Verticillium dahliae]
MLGLSIPLIPSFATARHAATERRYHEKKKRGKRLRRQRARTTRILPRQVTVDLSTESAASVLCAPKNRQSYDRMAEIASLSRAMCPNRERAEAEGWCRRMEARPRPRLLVRFRCRGVGEAGYPPLAGPFLGVWRNVAGSWLGEEYNPSVACRDGSGSEIHERVSLLQVYFALAWVGSRCRKLPGGARTAKHDGWDAAMPMTALGRSSAVRGGSRARREKGKIF